MQIRHANYMSRNAPTSKVIESCSTIAHSISLNRGLSSRVAASWVLRCSVPEDRVLSLCARVESRAARVAGGRQSRSTVLHGKHA